MSADRKDFIKVNVLMNRANPCYIRPLDNEVKDVFNPSKNKYFKNAEAIRWILRDEKNNLIGRIAAFIYPKYKNNGTEFLTGCM